MKCKSISQTRTSLKTKTNTKTFRFQSREQDSSLENSKPGFHTRAWRQTNIQIEEHRRRATEALKSK